jgi:hypothetical protein
MPKQHEVERVSKHVYPFESMAVDDWFVHPAQMVREGCDNFRSQVSVAGMRTSKRFTVSTERVSPRSKLYHVKVTRTA